MAIGTKNDFKIYDEQYYGGMWESIDQNVNVFNAASGGGIVLVARDIMGDFSKESFIKQLGMVSRRNPNSTAEVDDLAMTQGELVRVKLNRRLGPVAQTLDSWKKINEDPTVMSYILGQMAGEQKVQEFLNTTILALVAAIGSIPALNPTVTAGTSLNHSGLVNLYKPFGDQGGNLAAFLMHSHSYYELVGNAIDDDKVDVGGLTIYPASPATYNKPTVVTDSPALVIPAGSEGGGAGYRILGLSTDAARIEEDSDAQTVAFQLITGRENLVYRYQGEYAFNIGVKGFAWDTAAGENPTDAALGTAANWKQAYSSIKHLAGTMMELKPA